MKIICPFISIFLTKNNAANFLDEYLPFDYTEIRIKINFRKECIFMTDQPQTLSCIDCAAKACKKGEAEKYPAFCLTKNMDSALLQEALDCYNEEENHRVMVNAANVESEFYGKMTRVEETVEFAKRIGAQKIGIGTCMGLLEEAKVFAKILRKNGFEVFGICCKAGAIPKTQLGISVKCENSGKNMCNPILQAKMLNAEHTDLNVAIGLCVGHDSLFYKYSDALVTTLISKDRVTGHNPCAVLYNANSYYKSLLEDK